MKSAKDIISHIKRDPLYNNLNEISEFFGLFSDKDKKLIAFIYIKEADLMIALKHPLGLQELKRDSSINFIKYLLNIYTKHNPTSKLAQIQNIKFFVADKYMKKIQALKSVPKEDIAPAYEPSFGKFQNRMKNIEIYQIFEEIRKIILANRRDQNPSK